MAARRTRLDELMTPAVACVTPDLSLEALSELFLDKGISGVPVVDDLGRPIGVVSKTDLLREDFIEGETREALPPSLSVGFHVTERIGRTVAEVMMPIAFTLREDDSVARAASLMQAEHVHRIPVVDESGRVTGIVTTFDLARFIAAGEPPVRKGTRS
jgi:CBS domain-containing protein